MFDKTPDRDETSLEDVGLLTKWLSLLRLEWAQRGARYGGLWMVDLVARLTAGASLRSLSEITPQLHVGGQYLRRGWRLLQERGVTAVINMRSEFDDRAAGIAPARYLHLPTIDNMAPTYEHLRSGVEFIEHELARGGRVYVHCEAGVGRAPTMAAAFLTSRGATPAEAWSLLRSKRPIIRPTLPQVKQVARFSQGDDS
ncbi:MAG: dual specificity protein phosphatase [Anaerolineales bacterium]